MIVYWLISLIVFIIQAVVLIINYIKKGSFFFNSTNILLSLIVVINFFFSTFLYFKGDYGFFLMSAFLQIFYLGIEIVSSIIRNN